jgi:hypothetical protein
MPLSSTVLRLASAACLGLAGLAVHADGGRGMPRTVPPAYSAECASCHIAYPPGQLPAPSWQRLMGGLDRHFGTDASLDPATVRQLSAWLQTNAATGRRAGAEPPQDRITRSAWFERKHRKVDAPTWKLASVRTASNCAACHAGAARGSFDEHD